MGRGNESWTVTFTAREFRDRLVGSRCRRSNKRETRESRVRGNRVSFARDNVTLSKPLEQTVQSRERRGRVYLQKYRNNNKGFFNLSKLSVLRREREKSE